MTATALPSRKPSWLHDTIAAYAKAHGYTVVSIMWCRRPARALDHLVTWPRKDDPTAIEVLLAVGPSEAGSRPAPPVPADPVTRIWMARCIDHQSFIVGWYYSGTDAQPRDAEVRLARLACAYIRRHGAPDDAWRTRPFEERPPQR